MSDLRYLEKNFSLIDKKKLSKKQKINIVLLSNYSTQFLSKAIKLSGFQNGFDANILETGYNQWEFSILKFEEIERKFKPNYVIISLTSQLYFYQKFSLGKKEILNHIYNLIQTLYSKTNSKIIFSDFEFCNENIIYDKKQHETINFINHELRRKLKNKIIFLNYDHLINSVGEKNWFSKKFLITSKLNCNPNNYFLLGNYFFNFISSIKKRGIRHIIIDLDNTLWGGVVGDVGYNGVDLNYESTGLQYLNLQRFLLSLNKKGVILSICSKNNEKIALEVFKKRKEMILKLENFANYRINWNPKSQNIDEIVNELNLTPTGTCFIDDSKFERQEVRFRNKEIYVPEMPEDKTQWVEFLLLSNKFIIPSVKEEDRERANFYKQESKRITLKKGANNIDQFLKSLKLKMKAKKLNKDNSDRAFDLINNTNQFNLTTKRYEKSNFNKILKSNMAYSYSLTDNFSNYGEIGVLVGLIKKKTCIIDNWVLSCRAMSRTVEFAMFENFVKILKKNKFNKIECEIKKTRKNTEIHSLLEKFDFKILKETKEIKKYSIETSNIKVSNKFVKSV